MEQGPDDFDDLPDEGGEDDDGRYYPYQCLKVVLRSGHEAIFNIDPPKDARRIRHALFQDDAEIGHVGFKSNKNHVWVRLEHVLFAELIDDLADDEPPELNGARVRFMTGRELTVDLPEWDPADEWELTPAEALDVDLMFISDNPRLSYQGDDGTFVSIETRAVELMVWGRDEASPEFDADDWARLQAKRKVLDAQGREALEAAVSNAKRVPGAKRKPTRRRRPARWR